MDRTLKSLSLILSYPSAGLQETMPAIADVFAADPRLPLATRAALEEGVHQLADTAVDPVALLASRMATGAILHCATDWLEYAEQMLAVLSAEPTLENTVADYAPRPASRPQTKFESRGLRLGHGVRDLLFRKRAG